MHDSAVRITSGLIELLFLQETGASSLPDHLKSLDQPDFRTATLGLIIEVAELANEAQWKPWRQYPPPTAQTQERILDETADVLHLLAWVLRNLCSRFGLTPGDFAVAFIKKHRENIARFEGRVPGREPPQNAEAPAPTTGGNPSRVVPSHNDAFLPPGWRDASE